MTVVGPFLIVVGMALVAVSAGLLAAVVNGRRALGRAILVAAISLALVAAAAFRLNHRG